MWVARDENGELGFFNERPIKGAHEWHLYANYSKFNLYPSLFPNLKWEDEPIEVSLFENSYLEKIKNRCSAISLMHYLDNNKKESQKMCLSNMECEQIDNAFDNNNWKQIINYIKKYVI